MITCLKKEIRDLIKNKKMCLFLIFIFFIEIFLCVKNMKNFIYFLYLFGIIQFCFENIKNDVNSGGVLFLINTQIHFIYFFLSKYVILFFISLIYFFISKIISYVDVINLKLSIIVLYPFLIYSLIMMFFTFFKKSDLFTFLFVLILLLFFTKIPSLILILVVFLLYFVCKKIFYSYRVRLLIEC